MKIVCVFAHPDDEAFATGGTIAKLSRDHEVSLICCTDGNHQEKNLKAIRESELKASAKILGIQNVFQLNYEDGHLCNANYHVLAADIRAVLDDIQPERLITFHPNGVSGHLDHIAVTSIVDFLFDKLSYIQEIWYYTSLARPEPLEQNYFVYRPQGVKREEMHQIVDVSTEIEKISAAIRAHASQEQDGEKSLAKYQNGPKEEYFMVKKK